MVMLKKTESILKSSGDRVEGTESEVSFGISSLSQSQQFRLTSALDEYLKSLEEGTSFDIAAFDRQEPALRRAFAVYLDKLNSLYGLTDRGNQVQASIPKTLGAFTLVREIGRGGMGIVYEATQAGVDRSVALKLLPMAATFDARQIARFKNESRAAGALQHPNIIPVYSVGEAEGIHYYAMQLIDGESVDHGIMRQRNPDCSHSLHRWRSDDWKQIVRWGIDVAEALHAAHETGVVHRDIKPSNLMIDREGKIWIADFGLARFQAGVSLTQSGDVIGTLRYMSPEQACGKSAWLDGRTDIYALAVTIYEMLALQPAHSGDDGVSILKAIDQNGVIPLRQRCPAIPRDLDTVITKAMAKSPADRYETSLAFAEDLQRVLAGQPTVARPPTAVERICRFAACHKRSVLASALACALGCIGMAISTVLIAAEKQTSDRLAIRYSQSEKFARQVVGELGLKTAERLADYPSVEPVRRQLLRETIQFYETFADSAASAPELRHDLAVTYGKIGTLHNELRSASDAVDALRNSEQLYAAISQETPQDRQAKLDWSISQNNLGESLHHAGELEQAAVYFAKAIKTQEKIASENDLPSYRLALATTLNNLGLLLSDSGAAVEAEATYLRAVELLRGAQITESGNPHADNPDSDNNAATGLTPSLLPTLFSNLSALLAKSKPDLAMQYARQALARQTEAIQRNPSDAKLATQVVVTLQTLGIAQSSGEDISAAIDSFERAIEISQQLLARWPEQPQYRRDYAISLNHLGLAFSRAGQLSQAAKRFEEALEHQRLLAEQFDSDAETQSMLGGLLNNVGFLHQQRGDSTSAAAAFRQAVEHQRHATRLAPQVDRYREYLDKHRYNLDRAEAS